MSERIRTQLEVARWRLGLSQKALSCLVEDQTGEPINVSTICRYETGRTKRGHVRKVSKVAQVVGVPAHLLLSPAEVRP